MAALFALTFAVSGFGLEAAAFRGVFVSRSDQQSAEYYSALAKLTVCGPLVLAAIAGSIVVTLGGAPFGIGWGDLLMVLGGACLFASATTLPLAKLRADGQVKRYVICTLVPTGLQVATKSILCLGFEQGVTGWAIGDLVTGIVAFALTAPLQWRYLRSWPVRRRVVGELLRLGLPLLPHTLSNWALSLSDRLVVAALAGVAAAGQYGLAAQLASIGTIVASELNRALTPEYGGAIRGGNASHQRLARVVALQRLSSVPVFALTALAGTVFLVYLAPDAYEVGVGWLIVLCAALMLHAWYYPPMNVLSIMQGRTARMPLITMTAAGVNVGLNVLLVRHFGPAACAYTTAIGYALLLGMTSMYAGRQPVLKWDARSAVVGAVTVSALVVLGSALIA